jgi:ATP-binding cassette subfamily B multidrug efflux pump
VSALRRTFFFIRPYGWYAIFLVITTVLPVAMELVVPRALRYVIDFGIEAGEMSAILQGSLIMLAAALVGAVATLGQGVCRAQISQGVAYDMRNRMFAHLQNFSFSDLDHIHTGQLMTRLSSDVDLVRMFASTGVALLLRALTMIFGSVIMMLLIDWQLALIMFILLPLAGAIIWVVMRIARPMFTIVQQKLSALNTLVQENLAGVQVVKAFVQEQHEVEQFELLNEAYKAENIKVGRLLAVTLPILSILTNVGIVAVAWFGGVSTIAGRLTVGELVAFNSYLMIGMSPLLLLGNILTMISRADASAERIWEVLDTVPAIQQPESAQRPEKLSGDVKFSRVFFHYDGLESQDSLDDGQPALDSDRVKLGADQLAGKSIDGDSADGSGSGQALSGRKGVSRRGGGNVLNGVSFEATAGQTVAILGATGSGKSSLVNLIPRFYDPQGGRVEVDGVDVRELDLDILRRSIGMVMQQTTLFHGTVRENIAYGRPEATLAEVIAAAEVAQAHSFITELKDGYDSYVEQRGANLSGGQNQRIAIARALLISPSILILDDSTSAVDMETEFRLQTALGELMRNRTTIIIAQRISSVFDADNIIILEHGRIVAQGAHAQLLKGSPIYQEIYRSQLGEIPKGEPA